MIYSLVVVLALAICFVEASSFNVTVSPDTVDSLDISKYIGLWYQMSADQIVYSTFEKNSYCITALYGENGDGTISVHNYATIGGPTGTVNTIDGYAFQTNPTTEPGRLMVAFDSDNALPIPAPYWVLELGPVNKNGQYDYSIVSDNLASSLFVLARDVNTFNAQYRDNVNNRLKELGFTGKKAPIDTYQGSDCVYEATRRQAQIKQFLSKQN